MAIDERAAKLRLLQRTGFGARLDIGDGPFGQVLDRVLTAGRDDTPPAPRFGAGGNDDASVQELTAWWLDRMVATASPWPEKRTLLWHGHFATSVRKVQSASLMLKQNDTFRRLGGGDFTVLAKAMVRDPALMIYLDATGNTARAPNENLARELMELGTIGVGTYTETDVRQAARALTGWQLDRDSGEAVFAAPLHAQGTQTILGTTKTFDDQSLVDFLVNRPVSPRYLATRFWGWLVSETPPSEASLNRIVALYVDGHDMTAMFRAMFTDPAFIDPSSVLVKQPIDWLVGAARALRVRPVAIGDRLISALESLGQVPFAPPNVGGWPKGEAWLTTSAAQVRAAFADLLCTHADLTPIADQPAANRPEALAELLGVAGWTRRTREALAGAGGDPRRLAAVALCAPEYVVST